MFYTLWKITGGIFVTVVNTHYRPNVFTVQYCTFCDRDLSLVEQIRQSFNIFSYLIFILQTHMKSSNGPKKMYYISCVFWTDSTPENFCRLLMECINRSLLMGWGNSDNDEIPVKHSAPKPPSSLPFTYITHSIHHCKFRNLGHLPIQVDAN